MTLKERIKKIISDHCEGSNKQFADLIKIAPSTIHPWDDEHLPKGDILQRIHKKFRVDINWLLTGEGNPYVYKKVGALGYEASESDGLYGHTKFLEVDGKAYAVTQHVPKGKKYDDSHPGGLGQAVEQLAQILNSGNEFIIRAILFNLQAFYDTIINQKRDKDRIQKLEEESEQLKERIAALEERLDRQTEEMVEFKKAAAGGEL